MAAEIPDGAVIVARAIINSSLWKMRPEDRVVAVTCLAIANKKARKWFDGHRQVTIQRGQFVRSRKEMSQECGLPIQVVRTSLDHLAEAEFLTRNLTKAYTLYTIPKYQHYQDLTKYSDYGVLKPTRDLTQHQPGVTAKSNPEFAQAGGCKHLDSKGVTELCKLCGENPTSQNKKSNHKQQQQTTKPLTSSPRTEIGIGGEGMIGGSAVVVRKGADGQEYLGNPCFRVSLGLLEDLQMQQSVAISFAKGKSVGQILRVVQQARSQRKPAGWARTALENDWWLPNANGEELQRVVDLVKSEVERTNAALALKIPRSGQKLPPRAIGEDERAYLSRVNDELKRRRAQASAGGQRPRKGS